MVNTSDYSGYMLFVYANGKVAKVPLKAYETKTNRKKLTGAFSLKEKIVSALYIRDNEEIMLRSSNNRALIFDSALLLPKVSKTTVGVSVMTLKAKAVVDKAIILNHDTADALKKYRCKSIPAAGGLAKDLPDPEQLSL
jgi:DNA gyrase subunit A